MKIEINGKVCDSSNVDEMREALEWDNQRGEYATIAYVECAALYGSPNSKDWDRSTGLVFRGKAYDIPQHYTMRNWYNSNSDCTVPAPNGMGRYYSKELSYNYNCERIISRISADMRKIDCDRKLTSEQR